MSSLDFLIVYKEDKNITFHNKGEICGIQSQVVYMPFKAASIAQHAEKIQTIYIMPTKQQK